MANAGMKGTEDFPKQSKNRYDEDSEFPYTGSYYSDSGQVHKSACQSPLTGEEFVGGQSARRPLYRAHNESRAYASVMAGIWKQPTSKLPTC